MTIDEKIKELEEKQVEILKEIEELKKYQLTNNVRWRAEYNGEYFYINSNGCICSDVDIRDNSANYRFLVDYYKTKEDAEKCFKNQITYQQLKDIALRLNKGQEIYWHNGSQDKYYIYFDYIENEFGLTFANSMRSLSGIYCLDEKYLDIAIDEIGEEKLRQLLEWGL